MKHKTLCALLITCLCPVFSAHGDFDRRHYCISSKTLTEIKDQMLSETDDMQEAYEELFQVMMETPDQTAGCVTQQDLAQICKNVWGDTPADCENFLGAVMADATINIVGGKNPVPNSTQIPMTNFSALDTNTFSEAVNKAVARRRNKSVPSKLQNMGPVFFSKGQTHHIDPFILAAISLYESDRGTSPLAQNQNNIAGLGGQGHWMSFKSVPDSIETEAQTLRAKVNNGKTTLRSLACSGSYCATGTSSWEKNVSSINNELRRFYNQIIQNN